MQTDMPFPNVKAVNRQIKIWNEDKSYEKYRCKESAIRILFLADNEATPNTDMNAVLLKVSVLNDFYSTHVFDTFALAKRIVCEIPNFDRSLKEGDYNLVENLAMAREGGRRFYSFASKYCSHHFPNKFFIYDALVMKALYFYQTKHNFLQRTEPLTKREFETYLRQYKFFMLALKKFQEHFKITDFSPKEIDIFLWTLGR